MPGWLTNGLPLASTTGGTLPLTGKELIAVDTQLSSGQAPQTEAISTAQLATLGLGPIQALTFAATQPINVSTGSVFSEVLTANSTISMVNPAPGQEVFLELTQDGTGSRLVTWVNVSWAAGTAPTLTTTANATDCFRFTWNATAGKWRGETVGKAFA